MKNIKKVELILDIKKKYIYRNISPLSLIPS